MTDINQLIGPYQSFEATNAKISKGTKTDAFENALSSALDKTEAPEMEVAPTNELREIASKNLNILTPSDIVSGETDKLLGMLDVYSLKLEDPNVSLKNIAPVLEEIKNNAGSLLKETMNLTADDELKKIATQTIVAAQSEYVKFQRGDYTA
jgi:hypothetical protein